MLSALVACAAQLPTPNPAQLNFMDYETIQFMHYGIPTYWDPPKSFRAPHSQ